MRAAATAALLLLAACGGDASEPPRAKSLPPLADPKASIEFSQILLLYVPVKERPKARTHDEAFAAARRLIARAKAGERFENLIVEATDDLDPEGRPFNAGSYTLAIRHPRDPVLVKYVQNLAVGDVGETPYDTGEAVLVIRRDR